MSETELSSLVKTGVVRYSRVLRLPWLVALGTSATVGLGVYTLLSIFGNYLDTEDTAGPYLILGLISIPIVLTVAERAAVIPGAGGLYRLAAHSRSLWVSYFTGWLMLAGYITLSASLAWGVALSVDLLLRDFFNLVLDIRWIAAGALALLAINSLQMISTKWRTRSTLVFAALIYLALLATRNLIAVNLADLARSSIPRSVDLFTVAAILASSLWGLDYILSVRDQIRRPTQNILPALGLTVLVGVVLGAFAAISLRGIDLSGSSTPLIDLAADLRIFPERLVRTVYAIFALFILLIALNRSLLNGRNLIEIMVGDGFLTDRIRIGSAVRGVPISVILLVPLAGIILILIVQIERIAAFAALTFLWTTALVHLPDVFRSQPNLASTRLPFHPLFPGLTLAIGILLPYAMGFSTLIPGALWLALGGLYYALVARQRGLMVRREQIVVGEDEGERAGKPGYRVMADISSAEHPVELIRAGAVLAKARGGDLLAVSTLQMREQIPAHLRQVRAREQWDRLNAILEEAGVQDVSARPLVRLAPNLADGILEAASEEDVDILLIEWHAPDDPQEAQMLDRILRSGPIEVAIVRGKLPSSYRQLLVPTAGGPHAPAALELAQLLAARGGGQIRLTHVVSSGLTEESEADGQERIRATKEAVPDAVVAEERVVAAPTAWDGILNDAQDADILLIGTTKEGILERSQFGGIPTRVAQAASIPTIISRARESKRTIQIQRIWGAISDPLPKLSLQQHLAVAQSMRDSAVPTIDFFILIGLAAGIASLGLLQNSGAVIIGAMLVAPLMSPILAMGMSMVLVEFNVLRTAMEATIKGVALAILVGVVMVILSPIKEPTIEILARTQPNILDLMVALLSGAAAGYALSRKEVAAAMPGVAIAAALVPPLCVVGYGLAVSDLAISAGALLLFTTNLIAIVLAAAVTFLALGFKPERAERSDLARSLRITAISLAVVFIVLAIATRNTLAQQNREDAVMELFEQQVVARAGQVTDMTIEKKDTGFLLTATIISYADQQLSPEEFARLEDGISEAVGGPVTLDATILEADRIEAQLDGLDQLRLLEQLFAEQAAEAELDLVEVQADETAEGYRVDASVVVARIRPLSTEELEAIQTKLEAAVNASVELQVLSLTGDRTELPGN